MPNNKLLYAMGVRRGLPYSHNHLRHFYEPTSYAKSTAAHMLGSGLHKTIYAAAHQKDRLLGDGVKRRDDSDEDEGKGLRHSKRRPTPLMFKF
jgi:hypothetical protein